MRFHIKENRKLLLVSAVLFLLTAVPFPATATSDKEPVAEVLGKALSRDEVTERPHSLLATLALL